MRNMNIKEYNNLPEVRYKSARISLLIVLFMSFINVFSIVFGDFYFVFSSYITSTITLSGAVLYIESGKQVIYLVLTVLLAVISLLPYLFCWIFSKKRYGWLIVSLVLFTIDSALLLFDTINLISVGEFNNLIDVVIHVYVVFSLALGVVGALKNKTAVENGNQIRQETAIAGNCESDKIVTAENCENLENNSREYQGVSRIITLNRKKSFYGCAVKLQCVIDGKQTEILKNGQSVNIEIDGNCHQLTLQGGMLVSKTIEIPAGMKNFNFKVSFKMHAMESEIIIEENL